MASAHECYLHPHEPAAFVWGDDAPERCDDEQPLMPLLQPTRMDPKQYFAPVVALKRIRRVDISTFKVINGVVFYVLDVFLVHPTSRIPTVNQSAISTVTGTANAPDFRILRRFREFDTLRRRVAKFARFQVAGSCPYCDSLRRFLMNCYSRPALLVKLRADPEARAKVLETFVNRLVQLSVGRVDDRTNTREQFKAMCASYTAVPQLVHHFVRPRPAA